MSGVGLAQIDKLEASGQFDVSKRDNSAATATGGRASTGIVFNTSGGSMGLVKTLALAGAALLVFRIWRSKKK